MPHAPVLTPRRLTEDQGAACRRDGYLAADALPLAPDSAHSSLYGRMVRGRPSRTVRREAGEMRLPRDFGRGYPSISEPRAESVAGMEPSSSSR